MTSLLPSGVVVEAEKVKPSVFLWVSSYFVALKTLQQNLLLKSRGQRASPKVIENSGHRK